jgi:hypothetical protein
MCAGLRIHADTHKFTHVQSPPTAKPTLCYLLVGCEVGGNYTARTLSFTWRLYLPKLHVNILNHITLWGGGC